MLERMWADDLPKEKIAAQLGVSGVKALENAMTLLRRSKRANLPRRRGGNRPGPLKKAADARGLDVAELMARIRAVLTADGVTLIDALLDDGVTTPDGDNTGGAA